VTLICVHFNVHLYILSKYHVAVTQRFMGMYMKNVHDFHAHLVQFTESVSTFFAGVVHCFGENIPE
jgi:hypothetical protein